MAIEQLNVYCVGSRVMKGIGSFRKRCRLVRSGIVPERYAPGDLTRSIRAKGERHQDIGRLQRRSEDKCAISPIRIVLVSGLICRECPGVAQNLTSPYISAHALLGCRHRKTFGRDILACLQSMRRSTWTGRDYGRR